MTLTVTSGAFTGFEYLITDWDQATQTGTITPGWTSALATFPAGGDTIEITQPFPNNYHKVTSYNPVTRTGTVSPQFIYTTLNGTKVKYTPGTANYELLKFANDNVSEITRTDSSVNKQQAVCHEIQLISLTLPNVLLKTGVGGRITFYPYVYVKLKSATAKTNAYTISSNSPNAVNAMFTAPMVYNYDPENAAFVTLDGHGMVQTLKFQPNDTFELTVLLPNGELFTTEEDTMSPAEPNPYLQISACFKYSRIQCTCCNPALCNTRPLYNNNVRHISASTRPSYGF